MKVIDLLNKIANGEEVPKRIKIRGIDFKFTEIYTRNLTFADRGSNINYAYKNDFENYWLDCARVNEEIEIIEEDKKIEKINIPEIDDIKNARIIRIEYKINELIDEVNKLKGDKNE